MLNVNLVSLVPIITIIADGIMTGRRSYVATSVGLLSLTVLYAIFV